MTTQLKIYWDTQDPRNEGWAYRTETESGALDADADDLDDAIREACMYLGLDIDPDQFAREPHIDGGFAVWDGTIFGTPDELAQAMLAHIGPVTSATITWRRADRWGENRVVMLNERGDGESYDWDEPITASSDAASIAAMFGVFDTVEHDGDTIHVTFREPQ